MPVFSFPPSRIRGNVTPMTETPKLRPKFWEKYALEDMNKAEWEAICDGCGKCCLVKLEDFDTAAVEYTNIACRLFDDGTCRCSQYEIRKTIVKDCVVLTPEKLEEACYWLPSSCGYKLLHEGYELPLWHPIFTGNRDAMHSEGASMINKTVPEYEVDEEDYEDYVVKGLQ